MGADPITIGLGVAALVIGAAGTVYTSEQQSKASRRQARAQEEANRLAEEQAEENEQETNRANAEQVNAAAILGETELENPNILNGGEGIKNIASKTGNQSTLSVGNTDTVTTGTSSGLNSGSSSSSGSTGGGIFRPK